jgi:hypothetical protein
MTNKAKEAWTAERVRALGVKTDLVTACSIIGVSRTRAWEMYHAGELPFPAIRVGRRVVVPTAPVLALLGLANSEPGGPEVDPKSEARPATGRPATNPQLRTARRGPTAHASFARRKSVAWRRDDAS